MTRVWEALQKAGRTDPTPLLGVPMPAVPTRAAQMPSVSVDARTPAAAAALPPPLEAFSPQPATAVAPVARDADVAGPGLDALALMAHRLFLPGGPGVEGHRRSVVFSAISGDTDAAEVCAGTAEALVRISGASVCVMDLDLRNPGLERRFGIDGRRGVAEAVLSSERIDRFMVPVREQLWLIPAGHRCSDALPLLSTAWLRTAVSQVTAACDFVLLCCAPAGAYADATTLGRCADGVVLVVDAGATRRVAAKRVTAALHAANVTVLGAVLANRTYPIPESLYQRL